MTLEAPNLSGKTVLITGANQGIGKAAAIALGKMGAKLVLVCRNIDKAKAAIQEIRASGAGEAELIQADVSSLADLQRAADTFRRYHDRLDVLLNNAGMLVTENRTSVDGFEMTFATNHLGYFYLTHLLQEPLRRAPAARVVNVASDAHYFGWVNFDRLQHRRGFYSAWLTYCDSKLLNVIFTLELARRLEGTAVTANCLHPGVIGSGFAKTDGGFTARVAQLARPLLLTPEEGAKTSVFLSASPEVEGKTGRYWYKHRERPVGFQARNPETAARLWALSEELCGLRGGVSAQG